MPVLVIQGTKDQIAPAQGFSPKIAQATGGRLASYPCGHQPFSEVSEQFNRDVADFIASISASA